MTRTSEPASTPWQALIEAGSKCGTEGLNKRISQYSQVKRKALRFRRHIIKTFDSYSGDQRDTLLLAGKRLSTCGNFLQFRQYPTAGELRLLKTFTCKQFLICPLCAVRRASLYMQQYIAKCAHLGNLDQTLTYSLMTLTVQHSANDSLIASFDKLRNAWKNAHQRIKDCKRGKTSSEFGKILGWVGAYEVTNSRKNGFHPHVHILVLHRDPINENFIRREWLNITGDSTQVDVTPAKNPDNPVKDFLEVFKYTLKFTKMRNDDVIHTFLTLKGKRLLFSGGILRGVTIPENLLDVPLENLPYVDLFYQYVDGKGYQLQIAKADRDIKEEGYVEIASPVMNPICLDDLLTLPDLLPFASEEVQEKYWHFMFSRSDKTVALPVPLPGLGWF